jgi:hypothetical protein
VGVEVLGEQRVAGQVLELDDHVVGARVDVDLAEELKPGGRRQVRLIGRWRLLEDDLGAEGVVEGVGAEGSGVGGALRSTRAVSAVVSSACGPTTRVGLWKCGVVAHSTIRRASRSDRLQIIALPASTSPIWIPCASCGRSDDTNAAACARAGFDIDPGMAPAITRPAPAVAASLRKRRRDPLLAVADIASLPR